MSDCPLDPAWARATLTRLGVIDHPVCQVLLAHLGDREALRVANEDEAERRAVITAAVRQARHAGLRGGSGAMDTAAGAAVAADEACEVMAATNNMSPSGGANTPEALTTPAWEVQT
jgi:GTP cyclohydrolase III